MKKPTAAQIMLKKHNAQLVARSIIDESIHQSGINKKISSILERNSDLTGLLISARDFIAEDANCGPAGVGLVCMINDLLEGDIK